MNRYSIFIIFTLITINIILGGWLLLHTRSFPVLNPAGFIAIQERNLIITAIALMLIVVIPVFLATIFIAFTYRASNAKATYSPDWTGNKRIKLILWMIPAIIIFVLAIVTWKNTHALDPYKQIPSSAQPLTIEVVALNWKWLFIYPKQGIATVNFIQFPVGTPIHFVLTADAPMNSFWIPSLGGQMYAMTGMQTQLHLLTNTPGAYPGSEVEINGKGYAGMRFIAKASSLQDFDTWVHSVKQTPSKLDLATYTLLTKPSEYNPPAVYASVDKELYNEIIMKYMAPHISETPENHPSHTGNTMPIMQNTNY